MSGKAAGRVSAATENAVRRAAADLGYRPNVPITKEQFANSELRNSWVRDKGMQVLQFWSERTARHPSMSSSASRSRSMRSRFRTILYQLPLHAMARGFLQ